MNNHHDKILILDFGSQVTQLIARRIREANVYTEIKPFRITSEEIKAMKPHGIILSGGPASVLDEGAPMIDPAIFSLGIPVLGICYGQQLIAHTLGGRVTKAAKREFGRATLSITQASALWGAGFAKGDAPTVWMSHGDHVDHMPEAFEVIANTSSAPYAAFANKDKDFYGVQFHPEVIHTPDGATWLRQFVIDICGCKPDWTMAAFQQEEMELIRQKVGDRRVLCAVSGGVDSTVVAALLHKALGAQLTCIFVDNGLLRLNEAEQVKRRFTEMLGIPLVAVDAAKRFVDKLHGVSDPERKRKIIGETFIEVFEEQAEKVGGADFLAQGTLYPDVIESVSFHGGPSVTIKSHHNVGGLPERMNLKLIEPIRALFKDEVRALGRELGIDERLIERHPFPGPGLAIRVPGEITPEKLDILREADAIFIEAIREAGLYNEIWQAFAALLPVRSVGVMGDARTYDYVCALRAVTSTDGMTADYYPFQHDFLGAVSNRIINEVRGINRVVYDVTSKPPGTIEWE